MRPRSLREARGSGCAGYSVADELEQVVVGIAQVHALAPGRAAGPAADASDRSLLHGHAQLRQSVEQRGDAAVPGEAEVGTARPGLGRPQGDLALQARWVHVELLVATGHRHHRRAALAPGLLVLDAETEGLVEAEEALDI